MAGAPQVSLIYCSKAAIKLHSEGNALAELLEQAAGNNRRNGVSGVLCLSNGQLFQCLEGSAPVVNDLYLKIARDVRHSECQLLDYRHVQKRLFAEWGMGFVDPALFTEFPADMPIAGATFEPSLMTPPQAYRLAAMMADPGLLSSPDSTAERIDSNLRQGIA